MPARFPTWSMWRKHSTPVRGYAGEDKEGIEEHEPQPGGGGLLLAAHPRAPFPETIREAGLNKYLFEMANIRDQCSWVHAGRKEEATRKAKRLLGMAVGSVSRLEPLHRSERGLIHSALVVGGGLAGMTSALNLAEQGFNVTLVEREKELGGLLRGRYFSAEGGDPQQLLRDLVGRVTTHPLIEVLCGYTVVGHSGAVGNFQTKVAETKGPRQRVIDHGTTIIATGGREYGGRARLQGDDGRVITQEEMEKRLFVRDPSVSGGEVDRDDPVRGSLGRRPVDPLLLQPHLLYGGDQERPEGEGAQSRDLRRRPVPRHADVRIQGEPLYRGERKRDSLHPFR